MIRWSTKICMSLVSIFNLFSFMFFFIFISVFAGIALWYLFGSFNKEPEIAMQSELSDPTVNFAPIWFWRPHMQILEVLYKNDPYEVTRKQINAFLWKSKNHAYERQLWLWGYVNREVRTYSYGKVHFYTLTPKGKNALITYNSKF